MKGKALNHTVFWDNIKCISGLTMFFSEEADKESGKNYYSPDAISFNLECIFEILNKEQLTYEEITNFIQEQVAFLREYGYEIEEIIYTEGLFIPDYIDALFVRTYENLENKNGKRLIYKKK